VGLGRAVCYVDSEAKHVADAHVEIVNGQCGCRGTPSHAALYTDHEADVNLGDRDRRTPLVRPSEGPPHYATVARTRSKPRHAVRLNVASIASCVVPWTS
jgi:hypothetical protein